jgi:aryl-alcohol dehydrogenase-like predicted oxidoreductase
LKQTTARSGRSKTKWWKCDVEYLRTELYAPSVNIMQTLSSIGAARLALGTAQFGLPYGIANTQGQVNLLQAELMLGAARDAGIDTLDTAISYGEAEELLGRIGVVGFRLISKIPALRDPVGAVDDWIMAQVEASLERLRVPRLGGLLLHAPDDLLGPNGPAIVRGLQRARDAGLAERVGLSVYSPEQLAALIDRLPLEIVQIPANVFDRRFAQTDWLDRLAMSGIEVHARSAFLQGLLLMPSDRVPSKFAPYRTLIDRWHAWLAGEAAGTSPVQACLAHVASYPGIARLVVGADSFEQLQDIIEAVSGAPLRAPESLTSPATPLINPAQWSAL